MSFSTLLILFSDSINNCVAIMRSSFFHDTRSDSYGSNTRQQRPCWRLLLCWLVLPYLVISQADASVTGDPAAGEIAFRKCASCHQTGPSARGGFGPQLNGIIGRTAGSTTDYKYSAEMKKSNIVWSEKNLTAFLKSPSDVVPGTKMRFFGISDEQQIANLLAYLRSFR